MPIDGILLLIFDANDVQDIEGLFITRYCIRF